MVKDLFEQMLEEFVLVRDFAIIMAVAGAVTLLFRWLRQPPILGYLIAGLIISPYTIPILVAEDIATIRFLADLGLVLLLFGIGLEFSWNKMRGLGLTAPIIGGIEICTMLALGYGLGRLFGWSTLDSFFLGAAMTASSSAIIVKILRDMGRLELLSSNIIVGVLVVEDFAAIALIAVLSGIATTETASLSNIALLVLRVLIFAGASLGFGALLVPRIIEFTHRFHSREALLLTSISLCFIMALLGKYLGLSVAVGAFLMGALIGDTRYSQEVNEVVAPVRDMFAALFFVSIGMLVNIFQFKSFVFLVLAASAVFILGKIISNTLGTFLCGFSGRTSLQVGTGMSQAGEFSLAIAKVGVDSGAVMPLLYPVVAGATAITSFTTPYIMRLADPITELLNRRASAPTKKYLASFSNWVRSVRRASAGESTLAREIQHAGRNVFINLLLIMVFIGIGAVVLQFVDAIADFTRISPSIVGMLLSFLILILCVFALISLWRHLSLMIDKTIRYLFTKRSPARALNRETLRIIIRYSIILPLSIFLTVWSIPLIISLFHLGSFALAIIFMLLATLLYFLSTSVRNIHRQLETTFRGTLFGQERGKEEKGQPPGQTG
jgi:CPA2 family monovalent cation:H+ antiporter-2